MKVYVLRAIYGEYEDRITKIEGIYAKREKAEEEMGDFKLEMKRLAAIPNPCEGIEDEDMTSKDWDDWKEWYDKTKMAREFYRCYIEEYNVTE